MTIRRRGQLLPILVAFLALLFVSAPTLAWKAKEISKGPECKCVKRDPIFDEVCLEEKCCTFRGFQRWDGGQIPMRRVRSSFPDDSPEAKAIADSVDRWNKVLKPELTVSGIDTSVPQLGNGISEIYEVDLPSSVLGRETGVIDFDWSSCRVRTVESDVEIDTGTWHTTEDGNHQPYSGAYLLHNTLLHELGHTVGLAHDRHSFSILGASEEFDSRNGDQTYTGPGGDATTGARFLYGNSGAFDLGIKIWKRIGSLGDYSVHGPHDWGGARNDPDNAKCRDDDKTYGRDSSNEIRRPVRGGVPCFDVDGSENIQAVYTLENMTGENQEVELSIYLSDDDLIDDSDRLLTKQTVNLTFPDPGYSAVPVNFQIPPDVASNKSAFIGARVTSSNPALAELESKNNWVYNPITVVDGNDPPTFDPKLNQFHLEWNTTWQIQLGGITDPEGGPVSAAINKNYQMKHGSISGPDAKGWFTYTPNRDFVGFDYFYVILTDEHGLSSTNPVELYVIQPTKRVRVTPPRRSGRITSNPAGIDCSATSSQCDHDFGVGGTVEFLAQATDPGDVFLGWDSDCSPRGIATTCRLEIDSNKIIGAEFERAPTSFDLNVETIGSGAGTVTSEPAGIDCGSDCAETFPAGPNTRVTLTARPDETSVFRGWNGVCVGRGACEFSMYRDRDVVASFETATPQLFEAVNLDDDGPGSLRQAIRNANANPGNDIIRFAGDVSGTIVLTSGELEVSDSLTLEGPGADRLMISGNDASRVLTLKPGPSEVVKISGVTIKDGSADENGGGGILVKNGTIEITDCAIRDNASDAGGGGGGIRKDGPGSVTIINSTISGNHAIDAFDQGGGGGVRNDEGNFTLINTTVSGNQAATGGGVTSDEGWLDIGNSTITGNSAVFAGGGVLAGSQVVVANSLIVDNRAPDNAEIDFYGGIFWLSYVLCG